VRIEDIDTPRVVCGADILILQQLHSLGMFWDDEVLYQSSRHAAYQDAFDHLLALKLIYPCGCSRREIADSVLGRHHELTDGERPYPGTCRLGLPPGRLAKSWRIRVQAGPQTFMDRFCGQQTQCLEQQVGDFVIRRADGLWAYQLAVVVDDGHQGITDIVRGQDLLSSTVRQQFLAQCLGLPAPRTLHVPVITDERGLKLSKQNGAAPVPRDKPLEVLQAAWVRLGFEPLVADTLEAFWPQALAHWDTRFHPGRLAPC
jgi:glutamyl-Q tRNA(Asp) synthetase